MSTAYTMQTAPKALFDYDKYWASCFDPCAIFADVTRGNGSTRLGQLDFILVCGDAYIDHPSFVQALSAVPWKHKASVSGLLRSRTGPAWKRSEYLGKPNIAWGVTAGQYGFHDQPLYG